MKFRVQLFGAAALFVAGAALAQTPIPNNIKLFQPDNNPMPTKIVSGSVIGLGVVGNPAAGSSFQVIYATAFNQGTESVKVMNTGTSGGVDGPGTICVNVYVFDTAQNLQDCCYCKVSPNGLGTIPLNNQFNLNAFSTAVIKLVATYPNLWQGNGAVVASPPAASPFPNTAQPTGTATETCNPSIPATGLDPTMADAAHAYGISQGTSFTTPGPVTQQWLAPGMAAWLDTTPFQASTHPETEFHQSTLSMGEAANLAYKCQVKYAPNSQVGTASVPQCPAATCGT